MKNVLKLECVTSLTSSHLPPHFTPLYPFLLLAADMAACGPLGTGATLAVCVAVTVMLLALNLSTDLGGYGGGEL